MIEEKVEELELNIEKFRIGLEEKRSLLHFENAFFIPLFAIILLLSFMKPESNVLIYLFILAIALVMVDLIYSIFIYKKLEKRSTNLDSLIGKKIKRLHS